MVNKEAQILSNPTFLEAICEIKALGAEIEDLLAHKQLNLRAALCKDEAYEDAEFVVIATPTDYDTETDYFNTRSVIDGARNNHFDLVVKTII